MITINNIPSGNNIVKNYNLSHQHTQTAIGQLKTLNSYKSRKAPSNPKLNKHFKSLMITNQI